MKKWRQYVGAAAGLGVVVAVLSSTSAGPVLAQTFKPLQTFIVNTIADPVPVTVRDEVVRPFHSDAGGIFEEGHASIIQDFTGITVPPNKVLVIDHVSAEASLPVGQMVTAEIITRLGFSRLVIDLC